MEICVWSLVNPGLLFQFHVLKSSGLTEISIHCIRLMTVVSEGAEGEWRQATLVYTVKVIAIYDSFRGRPQR